ncbi:MAG: hypothetical protein I8H70_01855 [Burkholderiales bacterium]|nr:hypothetical protein [Burkholderiales bacterium]
MKLSAASPRPGQKSHFRNIVISYQAVTAKSYAKHAWGYVLLAQVALHLAAIPATGQRCGRGEQSLALFISVRSGMGCISITLSITLEAWSLLLFL